MMARSTTTHCKVCIKTRGILSQPFKPHSNQCHIASVDNCSSSTNKTDRQQCSADNVLPTHTAAHDIDVDIRTAATSAWGADKEDTMADASETTMDDSKMHEGICSSNLTPCSQL